MIMTIEEIQGVIEQQLFNSAYGGGLHAQLSGERMAHIRLCLEYLRLRQEAPPPRVVEYESGYSATICAQRGLSDGRGEGG
jgi:hypothetical protein